MTQRAPCNSSFLGRFPGLILLCCTALLAACGGGGGSSGSSAPTVVAPTITTQPQPASVNDGATATFTVVAAGTAPLSYQWTKGGANISGATAASYTTPALTLADSGSSFAVVVSNSAGSLTSSSAALTVNAVIPTITTQPANQMVLVGAMATFTVVANGGSSSVTYQWQNGGTNITGATAASYTTPVLALSDSGSSYTVVVSDSAGHVTSSAATVMVTASSVAPSITVQPANRTVVDGTTATFTVVATGTAPLTYQWQKGGTNIGGATAASYTTPVVTIADNGSAFTVVVTNSAGTKTSNPATLTVTAITPTITTQPSPQTVMVGVTATFTVVATGGSSTLSYQWQKGGTNIAGANAASYTTLATVPGDNGASFTVAVSDSGGSVTSVPTALTVTHTLALLAGKIGGVGNVDGTGGAAWFYNPAGVAMDSAGNIYVADSVDQTIREISTLGVVTTLAGTPYVAGYTAAPTAAASAQFNNPTGVAVDGQGNVYVADTGNNVIRVITAGIVSTFAGTGVAGLNDGAVVSAQFSAPTGVAADGANPANVYIADTNNDVIREITGGTTVATIAGTAGVPGSANGTGTAAAFNGPRGVAVDAAGNVYVADWLNSEIRKITSVGVVTTLAGTPGTFGELDGTGAAAIFSGPVGVSLDSAGANLFVADFNNNAVRQITTATGAVVTLAGSSTGLGGYADATGTTALFLGTSGTVVDASGNVYVADLRNNLIREINHATAAVTTFAGNIGGRGYTDATSVAARFSDPNGIASDPAGNLYLADSFNDVIRKIDTSGVVTTFAGNGAPGFVNATGTLAQFNTPVGVAIDSLGNLYVADQQNCVVRQVTPAGVVSTYAGSGTCGPSLDGTGAAAQFGHPTGVATDASNNVFVADYDNNTIRQIAPGGVVTTLAGTSGVAGFFNATGAAAQFWGPRRVATDAAGDVYVTDQLNNAIREITPGAVVTTLAGSGLAGYADGTGAAAQFNIPSGLDVDPSNNVYVADYGNHVVRQITSAGVVTTIVGVATSVGVTAALSTGPIALPGSLNGPSNITILRGPPGAPLMLVISEEVENSILVATLP